MLISVVDLIQRMTFIVFCEKRKRSTTNMFISDSSVLFENIIDRSLCLGYHSITCFYHESYLISDRILDIMIHRCEDYDNHPSSDFQTSSSIRSPFGNDRRTKVIRVRICCHMMDLIHIWWFQLFTNNNNDRLMYYHLILCQIYCD